MNKVYIQSKDGYRLVMITDMSVEDILKALQPEYQGIKVLVTDDNGDSRYLTR